MNKRIAFLLICLPAASAYAQTEASKIDETYQIPFATSDNRIELDVVNTGASIAENVQVKAVEKPAWLVFDEDEVILESLETAEERPAIFSFSVDRLALVGESATLIFEITANNAVIGTKAFSLQVEAPKEATLMQNYPNPFNPETTIGFDIPVNGKIDLRIYDILGREVAVLAKGERTPGHHQIKWDASRFASGTYFYLLKTEGPGGEQVLLSEKMLLVK